MPFLSFRPLLLQVISEVGCRHEFSAICIVGGRDFAFEQSNIGEKNIIVATPGRLLQHIEQSPEFDLNNLQIFVLDEADRILDMGFQETVRAICDYLPTEGRQTLLFSATLATTVQQLAQLALKEPELASVSRFAQVLRITEITAFSFSIYVKVFFLIHFDYFSVLLKILVIIYGYKV
jgi:ATP-dependent RNA helicase DDX10/DBP4